MCYKSTNLPCTKIILTIPLQLKVIKLKYSDCTLLGKELIIEYYIKYPAKRCSAIIVLSCNLLWLFLECKCVAVIMIYVFMTITELNLKQIKC